MYTFIVPCSGAICNREEFNMLVAIYTRVSTDEQAKEGYSISEQESTLRTYCQLREWQVYDVYSDPGFSGSNLSRPAMQRLIYDAQHHKFDMVLVKKLDRLSRSQKDTLHLIEDVLTPAEVGFLSMSENFDTNTPVGKAVLGMLSVFAQFERETIKERTHTGRVERAKDGFFHGGGHIPYGYRFVDSHLVVDEYEAMQIREAYKLFLEGNSIHKIYTTLHKQYGDHWKHSSSAYNALTLPIYHGSVTFGGKTYEGKHEAIVSDELWSAAQDRWKALERDKVLTGKTNMPFKGAYLLSGLLRCSSCGGNYIVKGNYSGHGDKKVYRGYYTCISRAKTNKKRIIDPNCKNKSWPTSELDQVVTDLILELSSDQNSFMKVLTGEDSSTSVDLKVSALQNRLHDIDAQLKRLLDLYQTGVFPLDDITDRSRKLGEEQKVIMDELAVCQSQKKQKSVREAQEILSDAHDVLTSGDLNAKQEYVRSLIEYIDIDGEELIIHWTFT